ncbi:hypothetical protein FI667_g2675, partial [Globisporangium splendens]
MACAGVVAGAVFKRKKYVLGLSTGTEQILMKLSSDEQRCHVVKATALQYGKQLTRIDLHDVKLIKTNGAQGFSIVSQKGETLLDLEAENEDVRNNWLLCEDSSDVDGDAAGAAASSDAASKLRKMVEDKAKKQAYWAKRTQELEERKRDAEERKKQFSGAGLKYTAIAMTNRP